MKNIVLVFMVSISFFSCKYFSGNDIKERFENVDFDTIKMTNGFDFPVGKPNAKDYYNAQKFTVNNHLGEDWNGVKGGNTDLNDPIYAIANGYVSFAENIGMGWGNVIRVVHFVSENKQIESFYAHCNSITVKTGAYVNKGDKIGTIGNNNGQYLAHLHLELRSQIGLPIKDGYSFNTTGYLNPTEYIKNNRK
jgi:murein DD-endopeptidase MepM/ murein hydrolase activator NlpD